LQADELADNFSQCVETRLSSFCAVGEITGLYSKYSDFHVELYAVFTPPVYEWNA
jgi:hypothetical protein